MTMLKTQRFSVTLGLSVRLLKMQVFRVKTQFFHKASRCHHQEVFRVALFNPLRTFSNILISSWLLYMYGSLLPIA